MLRSAWAFFVVFLGFTLQAVGSTEPTLLELKDVYLPVGYDTDDTVEITVVVHLPDSCHKAASFNSEVTPKGQVQISVIAKRFEGDCHQGPIPISQVLSLGRLRTPGDYFIYDVATKRTVGTLPVVLQSESVHGTDQRLYPALTDAFLVKRTTGTFLRLRGTFTDSCQSIQKITFDTKENVLIAIPELNHPEREECVSGFTAFEKEFAVNELPKSKSFLLHVRGAGGRSFNKMN